MLTFLAVLHLVTCLLLIALVLFQDPKGGAAGGIFGGGGSNSLLGATGATSFLTRFTRIVAIGFAVLCLTMTWLLKRDTGSVLDAIEQPAGASAPVAPKPDDTSKAPPTATDVQQAEKAVPPTGESKPETTPAPGATDQK